MESIILAAVIYASQLECFNAMRNDVANWPDENTEVILNWPAGVPTKEVTYLESDYYSLVFVCAGSHYTITQYLDQ